MDEGELVKIIKAHVEQGLGSDLGDLSNEREEIFDRYTGERYGNEVDGESKVTTRDIMETIEWALPALLRHFAGTETPVEFEAEGHQDQMAAELETLAVRDQFWKENNGFTVLYLIFKTILMNPNGYVKVCHDETERAVFEHYTKLTLTEVAMIEDDDQLEMIEAEEIEDDPDHINPELETLYKVKIKRKLTKGRNLVMVLPEDEVVVDSDWAELDLDECPFVCHYPEKTQSELIQMGYDEGDLDEVYGAGAEADSAEETNRRNFSDETYADDETHKALRRFRYHECYMMLDWDDDGIAERRRVVMIGNKIFDNEEDDEQPIISGSSILMPHKHIGMSLAQVLLDLQEIKTTVWRQLLNNMYRMNNPRTIVTKGANLADVLANRTNGVIRAKSREDVTMEETKPIIGQVVPLLELLEQSKEMRSGITKQSSVPNPDTLRDSAQGSFLAMIEKADQRLDLLARVLGETIVKRIYVKLHGLIKRHGDLREIQVNGQWVQTDPTSWRKRENMRVRVGLGHTSKQARLVAAQQITTDHNYLIDKGAIADPEKGKKGVVSIQNVYEGRRLMVDALGEDVSRYYTNPAMIREAPPQPPPVDPNVMLIQSNVQIEQGKRQVEVMKMRTGQAMDQMKLQADYAIREREFQFKQLEAAYDKRIEEMEAQSKATAAQDKSESDRLKIEVDALKAQLQDAQNDEKLAMEKYKADLQSQTQLTMKELEVGTKQIDQLISIQGSQEQLNQNQSQMQGAVQQLSDLIQEMRQPKEIAYDDDGEIIGVKNPVTGEVKPLKRDAKGNPVGL